MSRSRRRSHLSRHYRPAVVRFLEKKGARRAVQVRVSAELRLAFEAEDLLEVLADFHEEHGRFGLAEQLRRGRDPAL